MTQEAQSLLNIEPALRWLCDHPTAYPKTVANRFDCDAEALLAYLAKNGPPNLAQLEEVKKSLGVLTEEGIQPPDTATPTPAIEPLSGMSLAERVIRARIPKKQRYWSRRPKTSEGEAEQPVKKRGPYKLRQPKTEAIPVLPAVIPERMELVRLKLVVDVEIHVRTITND